MWDSHVNRFVYEYPSTIASANGDSVRHSGLNAAQAAPKTTTETTSTATAHAREILPLGNGRPRVLGLAASNFTSTSRLKLMAAVRAPAMATVIQNTCQGVGFPAAPSSIPMKANGRANTV